SRNQGGSNNWGVVSKLLADDGNAGDRLGISVSFDGTRIVAGASQADGGGDRSGRAYLFESDGSTWSQTRVLVNDQVTTADEYGISVAVRGDVSVVGAWLDNRPSNNSGAAYVYDLRTDTGTVDVYVSPTSPEFNIERRSASEDQSSMTTDNATTADQLLWYDDDDSDEEAEWLPELVDSAIDAIVNDAG
ncbi:FG-GAP repeat protein, partial [Rubripirellula amarantea]|nr:FG-GAP repeat protein [Rubripirellula amarantea]